MSVPRSSSDESFNAFLDALARAGVSVSNERETRERLAEARNWRYAFRTLVVNGRSIGIRFEAAKGRDNTLVARVFSDFGLPNELLRAFVER